MLLVALGFVATGSVRAFSAPAPMVVMYSEFPPPAENDPDFVVTNNWTEFTQLFAAYSGDPHFAGVAAITSDAQKIAAFDALVAGSTIPIRASVLVRDSATLQTWEQTGYRPKFLDDIEATAFPKEGDAVFDLSISAPISDGSVQHVQMRVRKDDGSYAIIASQKSKDNGELDNAATAPTCQPESCDAGIWWSACCTIQRLLCGVVSCLPVIGSLCPDCQVCFQECCTCSVSNPCHSCDPCGLVVILCHFVPGGNC